VLYVLDEPRSAAPARQCAAAGTLKRLRDLGNTVIVVEHDEDAIRLADHVVDVGPGAGMHGGHIVAQGTPSDIMNNPNSLTGKYLTGELSVDIPERKPRTIAHHQVINARGNNLKNVSAEIPLGLFTCVTGVSGGGKSTLLIDTLYKAIARKLNNASEGAAPHDRIEGSSISTRSSTSISRRSAAPRAPIRRPIPALHANPRMVRRPAGGQGARLRARAISFNVKGGRCEACQGDGVIKIEMQLSARRLRHLRRLQGQALQRETWKCCSKASRSPTCST